MVFNPVWTKKGAWSLGRDPLGIQATSVRLYRTLVPGLTNVTNRLRYYSYYCWVVARYQDKIFADDLQRWRQFIRRAEALYALACESHSPTTSNALAGSEWAQRVWPAIKSGEFDFTDATDDPDGDDQYLQAEGGNFGQFYVASMQEVGLLQPLSGIPLVTVERGRPLAEAFASAVGEAIVRRLDRAIGTGSANRNALAEIGAAVYPSAINAATTEMTLLRDFLLATKPDVSGDVTRRTSAWLLLDLARNGVNIEDDGTVRQVFYHRHLPNGKPYERPGAAARRWQAYQANELTHVALEVLLNGLVGLVNRTDLEGTPATLCGALIEKAVSAEARKSRWADWTSSVAASEEVEANLAPKLLQALRRPQQYAADSKLHAEAIKLLATLWNRWADGQSGVLDEVSEAAGPGGRSMAGVFATLNQFKEQSTEAVLRAVLQRHLIADHLVIAGRKLAASGRFTYRFTQADGVLSDGTLAEYGYTNPRLRNLARFLRDAKLIDDKQQLTARGIRFVDEHQPT